MAHEVTLITGDGTGPELAAAARGMADWLESEMRQGDGGYAASIDADADGDIDLADHAILVTCLEGPNRPIAIRCRLLDFDTDDDVDLVDFAGFATRIDLP